MNHPAAVLKRIRADVFTIFSHANHFYSRQAAFCTAFHGDDPENLVSFFIGFGFQIEICIVFSVKQPVLFLCSLRMLQSRVKRIAKFDRPIGTFCFSGIEISGRFFFFFSRTFRTSTPKFRLITDLFIVRVRRSRSISSQVSAKASLIRRPV